MKTACEKIINAPNTQRISIKVMQRPLKSLKVGQYHHPLPKPEAGREAREVKCCTCCPNIEASFFTALFEAQQMKATADEKMQRAGNMPL